MISSIESIKSQIKKVENDQRQEKDVIYYYNHYYNHHHQYKTNTNADEYVVIVYDQPPTENVLFYIEISFS